MEKSCLIIEDNTVQRETIKKLVSETSTEITIYDVDNLMSAYKVLLEHTIDLFVVDIVLDTNRKGDISGVNLVNIIRNMPQYKFTPVVFVTSLEDPKMFAYSKLHCFSYLEKPFNRGETRNIFERALGYTTPRNEQEVLCLRKDGVLYPLHIDQIIYIECRNRSVIIHIRGGEIVCMPYMTCKQILDRANNSALFQCNRGIIANRNYIRTVDKANLIIELKECRKRLDIGVTYAKQVLDELSE